MGAQAVRNLYIIINLFIAVFVKGRRNVLSSTMAAALLWIGVLFTPCVVSANSDFNYWKSTFSNWAQRQGIERDLLTTHLMPQTLDQAVLKLIASQPEFSKTIWQYLKNAVSRARIKRGRALYQEHQHLLQRIQREYGIQPEYVVAIWGLESDYGSNFGRKSVLRSLSTLAFASKRQDFYRNELLSALDFIQRGEIHADEMLGSWAGAMGHTQFMPSTLSRFGVDYDRDSRRDVWGSLSDAFASTANYLSKSGWVPDEPWGLEVVLPEVFDWELANPTTWLPLSEWGQLGIRHSRKNSFDRHDQREARLFMPAGYTGPVFLVFRNFQVIKAYNNSDSYALAVGYLASQILLDDPLVGTWPKIMKGLSFNDKRSLQHALTQLGYDTGGIDGKVGVNTQEAIRSWQLDMGLPADGYADKRMADLLRFSADL